jgi:bisphosphoglycerate-dependent phosphoglycerate mutase
MPSDLPRLYLARHGDTAWTDSHRHTGRTDLPLNERGEQHARQLGGWLLPAGGSLIHDFAQRGRCSARFGYIDMRAQADVPSARRPDIHEEAFVKAKGKTRTGLPKHPCGITRPGGAP